MGRAAWRVWAPPLLVIMLGMFLVTYRDGRSLQPVTDPELILVVSGALALLVRLRWPVAVTTVAVLAGAALPIAAHASIAADGASIVALYTLATLRPRRIVAILVVPAAVLLTASSAIWLPHHLLDFQALLPLNYVVIAVAVGDSVRNRRALLRELRERAAQAERGREEEARRRVRDERVRIARDLHDVVAHHITLVNAQTGVALHLMEQHPDRARQALTGIRETSRTALDELRATVGLLRQDDDPEPGLMPAPGFDQLAELLDAFRGAGLDVRVTSTGRGRPTGTADVAGYRIVQEALTNAGKHGTGPRVDLGLEYGDAGLRITVVSAGDPARRGPGTGHGLIGMRERAEAAGGRMTAGFRSDGTFAVEAILPARM